MACGRCNSDKLHILACYGRRDSDVIATKATVRCKDCGKNATVHGAYPAHTGKRRAK